MGGGGNSRLNADWPFTTVNKTPNKNYEFFIQPIQYSRVTNFANQMKPCTSVNNMATTIASAVILGYTLWRTHTVRWAIVVLLCKESFRVSDMFEPDSMYTGKLHINTTPEIRPPQN